MFKAFPDWIKATQLQKLLFGHGWWSMYGSNMFQPTYKGGDPLWRFPKIGVPLVIIHFRLGFSMCKRVSSHVQIVASVHTSVSQHFDALHCTGYAPNAQPLMPVLPCRGPDQVRCHLQCFEILAWIRETRMSTTKDLKDMTAEIFSVMVDETYGKENEEFFPMVVMDYLKVELYCKVDMEVLYGKNWTWALTCWT